MCVRVRACVGDRVRAGGVMMAWDLSECPSVVVGDDSGQAVARIVVQHGYLKIDSSTRCGVGTERQKALARDRKCLRDAPNLLRVNLMCLHVQEARLTAARMRVCTCERAMRCTCCARF
jgi:hypothetical protein